MDDRIIYDKLIQKVGDYPFLMLIRSFPSWHEGPDIGFPYEWYMRWVAYNILCLVIVILFNKKIKNIFLKIDKVISISKRYKCLALFFYFYISI